MKNIGLGKIACLIIAFCIGTAVGSSAQTVTTLYMFGEENGEYPYAGLIQATDGNLYGATESGGKTGVDGTIFNITLDGTLTSLYGFAGPYGRNPYATPIQAANGKFYETAYSGGANNAGTVFEFSASGSRPLTLYSFCSQSNCTDGSNPYAGLIQATNGNLYGTTLSGGANGDGTVFSITPSGTLTTLHSFDDTDGRNPNAGLVQDTNGKFYGTTYDGGANGDGTVFSLSAGLGPFVETQTTSGKVGAAVKILGTDLTGATSVTFNGTAATFTVVSKSEITTTVPTGATTGTVEVTIPSGTLKSNTKFLVTP
jgi:uncharacterized repeat protein (TIGR03803 family)